MTQTLDQRMDFDHVIHVDADGNVTDAWTVYAPDLYDNEIYASEWALLDGFSGQYGYSGPMMHSSEFVGGGLERHILENPGYYVTLVNYDSEGGDHDSWAIAYREDA